MPPHVLLAKLDIDQEKRLQDLLNMLNSKPRLRLELRYRREREHKPKEIRQGE